MTVLRFIKFIGYHFTAVWTNRNTYLSSFEAEIQKIIALKREYLLDDDFQNLSYLAPAMNKFEQTRAILRVQDRLALMKASSLYVEEVKVYFPMLERTITTDYYYDALPQEELLAMTEMQKKGGVFHEWKDKLLMSQIYPEMGVKTDQIGYALQIQFSKPKLRSQLALIHPSEKGGALLISENREWGVSGGQPYLIRMDGKKRERR